VLTPPAAVTPQLRSFVGVRMEKQRPPSIAQAVQAVLFSVTPLHRFLVAFDGSSCKGEVPSVDAPGATDSIGSQSKSAAKERN